MISFPAKKIVVVTLRPLSLAWHDLRSNKDLNPVCNQVFYPTIQDLKVM